MTYDEIEEQKKQLLWDHHKALEEFSAVIERAKRISEELGSAKRWLDDHIRGYLDPTSQRTSETIEAHRRDGRFRGSESPMTSITHESLTTLVKDIETARQKASDLQNRKLELGLR